MQFIQAKFISTVQYVLQAYCIDDRCSRYQPHSVSCLCVSMLLSPCSQAMNAQYIVTIKSITNTAVGIMVILQVQTSNTVLCATVVTQVLTVSGVS